MTGRLLHTLEQAAGMLSISAKTLRRYVRAGEIRFVLVGKRSKFADSDLVVTGHDPSGPITSWSRCTMCDGLGRCAVEMEPITMEDLEDE